MKKTELPEYEPLKMEVIVFESEDIITTSGDPGATGWGPIGESETNGQIESNEP